MKKSWRWYILIFLKVAEFKSKIYSKTDYYLEDCDFFIRDSFECPYFRTNIKYSTHIHFCSFVLTDIYSFWSCDLVTEKLFLKGVIKISGLEQKPDIFFPQPFNQLIISLKTATKRYKCLLKKKLYKIWILKTMLSLV